MRELLHAARNFGLPWVDVKLVNLRREFRASINAGEDGSIVVGKVLEKEQIRLWLRRADRRVRQPGSKGIIDPTKVVRVAIQNAASVAALLITTG
jgi:chaperonin GroEL (HSP60 family)